MKKWFRLLVTCVSLATLLPMHVAHADAPTVARLTEGAIVALRGSPHLFIADADGVLHWGGDTRALANRRIDWSKRMEVTPVQLKTLPIGDPWLSLGLVKSGIPIYLPKWETNEAQPRLFHIQSIADLELFGIDGSNYGRFVAAAEDWEAKHMFKVADLPRLPLAEAVAPSNVIKEQFSSAEAGVLPKASWNPSTFFAGYMDGNYVIRKTDPQWTTTPSVEASGTWADVSIAIDAQLIGPVDGRFIRLGCRSHEIPGSSPTAFGNYFVDVEPVSGQFQVLKPKAGSTETLVPLTKSPAVRQGNAVNRIELTCAGDTISVRINGTQMAAVRDSEYRQGTFYVGTGTYQAGTVEAQFDNLLAIHD